MGWSTGSRLMSEIIETMEDLIPNYDTRVEIYKAFIEKFEDYDCDTLDECIEDSNAFEEAYRLVHPIDPFDEEEYFVEDDV